MTTPSVDRPVSVEPMTDSELALRRALVDGGDGVRANLTVAEAQRLFALVDALKSRALPLPRRYTGGPLEDGLYLWREDGWREGYWESREVVPDLAQRPFWFRHSPAPFWLIGPITIPPIPESEEASS